MDAIEAVSVSIAVNIGTENNAKYAMCSANGWMTAEKTKNCHIIWLIPLWFDKKFSERFYFVTNIYNI